MTTPINTTKPRLSLGKLLIILGIGIQAMMLVAAWLGSRNYYAHLSHGHSIAIGDNTEAGDNEVSLNFVGLGTYNAPMTAEEYLALRSLISKLRQSKRPDGSPGSNRPLEDWREDAEPPQKKQEMQL